MVAPVTNEERSEAKNKKMFPISVGLAIRPIGNRAQNFVKDLLTHQIAADFGIDHSGGHRINPNALGRKLASHVLGQTKHAGFCRRVMRPAKKPSARQC